MISDTAPTRPGEELDTEKLGNYLCENLPHDCLPEPKPSDALMQVEQFPGGHSNLTYLIRFGEREFVLRRPPFGPVAPTAHDMAREYRVLSLINPVFPLAPRPYYMCADPNVIGAPFYLMERRRGLIIRREIPAQMGDNLTLRRRVSEAMITTLAALHAVDIHATGIDQIGKPAGFVERQIRGWAGRWERAKTSELPESERIVQWLLERIPEPGSATIVHNDFKLDNVMLDSENPGRVVAVFDWEMCTVGDPLVDLGLLLCYWPEPNDPEPRRESISAATTQPGWLTRHELVEHYAARTGRDVSGIQFYEAFALFKVAVVIQQIYYRFKQGQTGDLRFAEFGRRAVELIQTAWQVAQTTGGAFPRKDLSDT